MFFFFEGKTAPISESDQSFLKEWLGSLPTVPSHYCRNTPSYQNKKFLEPDVTISGLHAEYKKAAAAGGKRVVNIKTFSETFHNLNYSVFTPRKDQCDTCVAAKYGNQNEADYLAHINNKNEAELRKQKIKKMPMKGSPSGPLTLKLYCCVRRQMPVPFIIRPSYKSTT